MNNRLNIVFILIGLVLVIILIITMAIIIFSTPEYEYVWFGSEIESNQNTPVNYTAIYWEIHRTKRTLKYAYFNTIEKLKEFEKSFMEK